jgi:hypothetical protein
MFKKRLKLAFVFVLIFFLCFEKDLLCRSSSETSKATTTSYNLKFSQRGKTPKLIHSNQNRNWLYKRKTQDDFWLKTQKMESHLSKEDLECEGNTKLTFPYPSYKPESSPCGINPNMRAPAGLGTKCNW